VSRLRPPEPQVFELVQGELNRQMAFIPRVPAKGLRLTLKDMEKLGVRSLAELVSAAEPLAV
jgi:hypothetical protein